MAKVLLIEDDSETAEEITAELVDRATARFAVLRAAVSALVPRDDPGTGSERRALQTP